MTSLDTSIGVKGSLGGQAGGTQGGGGGVIDRDYPYARGSFSDASLSPVMPTESSFWYE